jgi:hypothetical protein
VMASLDSLLTLVMFVGVGSLLAMARLPDLTREPRFWGRT